METSRVAVKKEEIMKARRPCMWWEGNKAQASASEQRRWSGNRWEDPAGRRELAAPQVPGVFCLLHTFCLGSLRHWSLRLTCCPPIVSQSCPFLVFHALKKLVLYIHHELSITIHYLTLDSKLFYCPQLSYPSSFVHSLICLLKMRPT